MALLLEVLHALQTGSPHPLLPAVVPEIPNIYLDLVQELI